MTETYFRRVGALRPSHLMYTAGIGALVDLPNFTVLVRGLDHWDYSGVPEWQPITETRLLAAVRRMGFKEVEELRPAPWLPGLDQEPTGSASRVGVPVMPFPSWLRCTACQELAPRDAGVFDIDNSKPRKPHEARFYHVNCHRKTKKKPLAVPARFVLACTRGHLDDFPYPLFVHRGAACPSASHPRLRMEDRAATSAPTSRSGASPAASAATCAKSSAPTAGNTCPTAAAGVHSSTTSTPTVAPAISSRNGANDIPTCRDLDERPSILANAYLSYKSAVGGFRSKIGPAVSALRWLLIHG